MLQERLAVVEATGLEPNPDTLNPFICKEFSVYSPIVRQNIFIIFNLILLLKH